MQAVILAGESGGRPASGGDPIRPERVDICGEPLLGRQLRLLARGGVAHVVLLAGPGDDHIVDLVGDGARWGLHAVALRHPAGQGATDALIASLDALEARFFVFFGDMLFDLDLRAMWAAHRRAAPAATVVVRPTDQPQTSELVELDLDGQVRAFHPRPHSQGLEIANLARQRLCLVEKSALAALPSLQATPVAGGDFLHALLASGARLLGYRSAEYIQDAATPEQVRTLRRDVANGRVERMSRRTPSAAVFMDRDGVLNVERSYISAPEQLVLIPGAGEAVRRLNASDYRSVVVTNQSVLARGECDEEGLARIHARLDRLLGRRGAFVDRLYYCPHHPDPGLPGGRSDLTLACDCRKPAPGLVLRARDELNLDLARSWMIGDSTSDIALAQRLGMTSILVRTGHAGADGKCRVQPDFILDDLAEAVNFILRNAS